jgi:hypothetical protein
VPGTASLATSPSSHIYLDPARMRESTPLLAPDTATPRKLVIEEAFAPESVSSRRQSTVGRRRVSGVAGRRMSMDRRSVRSRRSVVVERGESTDGQTVRKRPYISLRRLTFLVVQLCSCAPWYRHSVSTARDALHGVDYGHHRSHCFWGSYLPHVSWTD